LKVLLYLVYVLLVLFKVAHFQGTKALYLPSFAQTILLKLGFMHVMFNNPLPIDYNDIYPMGGGNVLLFMIEGAITFAL